MGYDAADIRVDLLRKDPATALGLLSRATGGFLINNTNDLARGFRAIDVDRRAHYLLTYTPANQDFNGEWRSVTVRVPDRQVEVRARSGYIALRGLGGIPLLSHERPALAALERSPRPADLPLKAGVFVFPSPGQSQVAVVAALPVSSLTFGPDREEGTRAEFTILARIRDAAGTVLRKGSEPYRLRRPARSIDTAASGEVLFFRQPELPPGEYLLDIVAYDSISGKAGVKTHSFSVPLVQGLSVSSAIVVARGERVPADEGLPGNPLYLDDVVLYPNLGEPLLKGEKAVTLFMTVTPEKGTTPSARLEVLRGGLSVASVPLALDPPVNGRIQQLWRVPLEPLSPGDYVFRITVVDPERVETRETAVRIVD